MKYIDAEKLIAEIERYRKEAAIARFDNAGENAECFQGKVELCDDLTHIIASLQQEQPEVDLEKEIKRFLSNATKMNKGEWRGKYPISDIGFRAVARHFYELGLNARKEK